MPRISFLSGAHTLMEQRRSMSVLFSARVLTPASYRLSDCLRSFGYVGNTGGAGFRSKHTLLHLKCRDPGHMKMQSVIFPVRSHGISVRTPKEFVIFPLKLVLACLKLIEFQSPGMRNMIKDRWIILVDLLSFGSSYIKSLWSAYQHSMKFERETLSTQMPLFGLSCWCFVKLQSDSQ